MNNFKVVIGDYEVAFSERYGRSPVVNAAAKHRKYSRVNRGAETASDLRAGFGNKIIPYSRIKPLKEAAREIHKTHSMEEMSAQSGLPVSFLWRFINTKNSIRSKSLPALKAWLD